MSFEAGSSLEVSHLGVGGLGVSVETNVRDVESNLDRTNKLIDRKEYFASNPLDENNSEIIEKTSSVCKTILDILAAIVLIASPIIIIAALSTQAFLLAGITAAVALTVFCLLPSETRELIFQWIYASIYEMGILIPTIFLLPIPATWFDPSPTDPLPAPTQRPILIVHGYLHNSSAAHVLRARLKTAGFTHIYAVSLGSPFKSIQEFAKIVQEKAQAIAKETGRADLALVGHSMGGLVSTYYATQLDTEKTVKQVITLATPGQGTVMANFGIGECATQMMYQSDFTKRLNEDIRSDKGAHFALSHLGSKTDVVVPFESAKFDKNDKATIIEIKACGHASFLFSSEVANTVVQQLRIPDPTPTSAVEAEFKVTQEGLRLDQG